MRRRILRDTAIYIFGVLFFWAAHPHLVIYSGDWYEYLSEARYFLRRPLFHTREPGGVLLWQACAWSYHHYRVASAPPGESAAPLPAMAPTPLPNPDRAIVDFEGHAPRPKKPGAPKTLPTGDAMFLNVGEARVGFRLLGALCGGAYLALLAGLLGEFPGAGARRAGLAVAVVLASAVTWNFMGQVEFYAPISAALILYYWLAIRYLRAPTFRRFVWTIAAWVLAVNLHRLALFHLPALALGLRDPKARRGFRPPTENEGIVLVSTVIFLALFHIIPIFTFAVWARPFLVLQIENYLPELITPFTRGWAKYVYDHSPGKTIMLFTFGSRLHLEMFFGFMALSAPIGVPLCLALWKRVRLPEERFLALSAIVCWIWALFWHPQLGWGDWDLFAHPAIPTNLLAAILILRGGTTPEAAP